ncbi:hypothetical protein [Paenibacillus sp. FJAT-26967]|uniref:hypothetical protein n=1 Tax=Paenibacillus sp. FJAT-26967 TaxID=1729690 RepID=UPI000838C954|nr:hypothetical protein [Paenibacillus sp. FJAT-26967]
MDMGKLQPEGLGTVGAWPFFVEGVCSGLESYLDKEMGKRQQTQKPVIKKLELGTVEDERCRALLQDLTAVSGLPLFGSEEDLFGFPVMWVGTNGLWYGCSGLNATTALRRALQMALDHVPNVTDHADGTWKLADVTLDDQAPRSVDIPSNDDSAMSELLQSAMQILDRSGKRLLVFDIALERF